MTDVNHYSGPTNFSEERKRMSENTPETPTTTPEVNVEADQAVINTAPDGGGVDNNEAPAVEDTASE